MKYLKKFNESVNKEKLLLFCEERLINLLDNDFRIHIIEGAKCDSITLTKTAKDEMGSSMKDYGTHFNWIDIKEEIITFVDVLKDEYSLFNDRIYLSFQSIKQQDVNIEVKDIEGIDFSNIYTVLFQISKD